MSKLERLKEIVSITHFINPHLFWYHKIDACDDDYRTILEIEMELAEYYNDHQAWTQSLRRPPINAMVAVRFLAWNKMIRARVDHVAGFGKNVVGGEFIMWAVDYGFPFQTKADQIYRLPEKLTSHINYVQCGGLINVVPADIFFMKNTMVRRISSKWDQRACDIVEKAINDSESIVFFKEYSINGQDWGELVIKSNMGVKFRLKDHLISLHLAAEAESSFHEDCLRLKTNKILPWMCNNGNSKFHTNRAYLFPAVVGITHNGTKCLASECDDIAKQKVDEWYERNQLTSAREAGFLDSTTEYTMTEGSVIDSLSIQKYDQHGADLTKIDEHDENQHMQLAGALSKSRIEKYVGGKSAIPPLPGNIDFEIKSSNVRANQTIETIDSEISAIKYMSLEESTASSIDVLPSKAMANDDKPIYKYNPTNATTIGYTKSFAEQNKTGANDTVTTGGKLMYIGTMKNNTEDGTSPKPENLGEYCERGSVMSDEIGSFAERLIRFRNQYIERTSGKKDLKDTANVQMSEVIRPKDGVNIKFATMTKTNRVGNCESDDLNATFHGLRMIPAGYDFMNLYDYKDEDHWHCKKSTINDRMPHNEIDLENFANRTFV